MDQEKFEKNKNLVDKYRDFILSHHGYMLVGYNDNEIYVDIKPEFVELANQFVSSNIEGVPLKIKPRSRPPAF